MNPATLLSIITIGISIWAFTNRQLFTKLSLYPYQVIHHKQWYRIFTHAFIHADWMHLIFNMIALWSFGMAVTRYFSMVTPIPSTHFYIMYFVALIISSLPDLIKQKNNPYYHSVGASGGVSAVIFSAIFFDPWNMIYIFFIPCPGILFGVIFLVYSSYMSKKGGDHINHGAHFYGSVFGFLYPILIDPSAIGHFIHQLLHPGFLG